MFKRAVWPLAVIVFVALMAATTAASKTLSDGSTKAESSKNSSELYIVRMLEQPAVAYEGGVNGLKATKPDKGKKIDPDSPEVTRYAGYLNSRHDDALAKANASGRKVYDFVYALNGFAAKLSPGQVAKLEASSDVVTVEKAVDGQIDTSNTPTFMGLTQDGGAWSKLGGVGRAGEDVIIGVVDTGIVRDSHPSFSDRTGTGPNGQDGKLDYQQIPGWHGKCVPGEGWTASDCGQKIIGARYYNAGFDVTRIAERDFLSPRDYNGHGSHTASTAGGNNGIQATGDASSLGKISGMAPRARIAAYKVCWEDAGDGGCNSADSVAAIDQAVADGVDVINFSISGTSTNYLDAVEVAFLFAGDAGVFVATSAGNTGPGNFTVAHISPWLASVAAGTHSRRGVANVVLGNGASYQGASLTNALSSKPLIYAGTAAKAGATAADAARCFLGTLDPAKVAGKIVFCDRGANALVEKPQEVKAAGGVGAIIGNVAGGGTNVLGLLHQVPTVHVALASADAIKAYITSAGAGATASLTAATLLNDNLAPAVASFSSRGPSRAGGGDIMKPDFMAPGEDILAAVAAEGNFGRDFDLLSGTSMSSPHVAGFGALLTQAHPDWSPAAMRSALATTALPGVSPAGIQGVLGWGSGQVNPTKALDPGLVYDAGFNDYLRFLAGQKLIGGTGIDASDLNLPSIAIGDVAGSQTVTRTVTNVGSSAATYNASIAAPAGFTVSVNPASFTIPRGGTQTYTATITRTTAPLGCCFDGSLTWSDGTHSVRSPIVVAAVSLAAPAEISVPSGAAGSGSTTYSVKFGYNGSFAAAPQGAVAATETPGTVIDDPTNSFDTTDPEDHAGFTLHTVNVPAGTAYARFSLFDAFTDGEDDLDMYVYGPTGTLVGTSGSGTSAEQVSLTGPAAGAYKVYVHGWQTDGPDANYTLFSWNVPSASSGNLTVTAPATATLGASANVTVAWAGLNPAKKYLGRITYSGSTGMPATVLSIN